MLSNYINKLLRFLLNAYLFKFKYYWVECALLNVVHPSIYIFTPNKKFQCKGRVGIGRNCIFQTDIIVGQDVMIAANCSFIARDAHKFNMVGITMNNSGRGDNYEIILEDDVWVGLGSIILSDVVVGRGSIIAAGSVVTKDVKPYSIVAGNPAKILKNRFNKDEIEQHEKLLFNNKL
jgi:acetyltransferase-like isoleucine patch superfamily enzyme